MLWQSLEDAARYLKENCEELSCRDCPFSFINAAGIYECNLRIGAPHCWELPGEEADNEDE